MCSRIQAARIPDVHTRTHMRAPAHSRIVDVVIEQRSEQRASVCGSRVRGTFLYRVSAAAASVKAAHPALWPCSGAHCAPASWAYLRLHAHSLRLHAHARTRQNSSLLHTFAHTNLRTHTPTTARQRDKYCTHNRQDAANTQQQCSERVCGARTSLSLHVQRVRAATNTHVPPTTDTTEATVAAAAQQESRSRAGDTHFSRTVTAAECVCHHSFQKSGMEIF